MWIYIIGVILLIFLLINYDEEFTIGTPVTYDEDGNAVPAEMNPRFDPRARDSSSPPEYSQNQWVTPTSSKTHGVPLPVKLGDYYNKPPIMSVTNKVTGTLPVERAPRNIKYTAPGLVNALSGMLPVGLQRMVREESNVSPANKLSGILPVKVGGDAPRYVSGVGSKLSGILPIGFGIRKGYTHPTKHGKVVRGPLPVAVGESVRPPKISSVESEVPFPLPITLGLRSLIPSNRDPKRPPGLPLPVLHGTMRPVESPRYNTRPIHALPVKVGVNETVKKPSADLTDPVALPVKVSESFAQGYNTDYRVSKDAYMTWGGYNSLSKGGRNNPGLPRGVHLGYDKRKKPYLELNRKAWGWGQSTFTY